MSSRVPREKAVFCEAVEITDLEQRRQFLDQACGADKELTTHLFINLSCDKERPVAPK